MDPCGAMNAAGTGYCAEPGRLYPVGTRCDAHSPWMIAGKPIPTPKPEWTAEGLSRATKRPPAPRRRKERP